MLGQLHKGFTANSLNPSYSNNHNLIHGISRTPIMQKRMRANAVVLQLSISAVCAVHLHNLVLVVRISAFNDNSSKLPSLQTPCIDPEAIVFDHKATLRIVAIDHCASFVLFEAFLGFIPNLTIHQHFPDGPDPENLPSSSLYLLCPHSVHHF